MAEHMMEEEEVLTVSLDESLELLEVDLLFGTSSTHCLFDLFTVFCSMR